MAITDSFNTDANFWKMFPELTLPAPFSDLYSSDKSRGKKESSDLMWAIALCYDTESRFYPLKEEDRLAIVEKDFLKAEGVLGTPGAKAAIELYCSMQDSPAKRQLRAWNEKLEQRTAFMEGVKYNAKNWKMLDEMMKVSSKLYEEYFRIQAQLDRERALEVTRGGAEESASEKGLI